MADQGFKRKLFDILYADVRGYSKLMGDDEEATVRTLKTYRAAINDLAEQYRGRIVDSPGDNILAEFNRQKRINTIEKPLGQRGQGSKL
jgi:adenylate cyclase